MTTLIDRAERLQAKLVDQKQLEVEVHVRDRMLTVSEQIRGVAGPLGAILASWDCLSATDLKLTVYGKRAKGIAEKGRSRARNAATRLENPELSGPDIVGLVDGKGVQDAIKAAVDTGKQLTATLLKALEQERLACRPTDVDDAVPDLPGNNLLVVKLVDAKDTLDTPISATAEEVASRGPDWLAQKRKKVLGAVATWEENFPILREALERESPEMRAFVKAASTLDGASLALLTPDVLDRLRSDDRLDSFRVRPL